jgi:hypothetical protein
MVSPEFELQFEKRAPNIYHSATACGNEYFDPPRTFLPLRALSSCCRLGYTTLFLQFYFGSFPATVAFVDRTYPFRHRGLLMLRLPKIICLFALSFVLASTAVCCHSQQTMDNAAVLKLKTAGLSDELIVQTINASPGHFDTSTDSMIAMKQQGLSDGIIGAMVNKNANPNGPAPVVVAAAGPTLPPGVDETGVYYKNKAGTWVEFSPEIVNYKSGGVLKSIATDGIVKGDKNGHVPGKTAALSLTHPVEFLIYAPDGTAPNEYQLLRLRANSNNREFRSETGGVFHKSSGADRDRIDFTATKVGTRLYSFSLAPEIKPGEYGILPPGAISSTNAASAGKIDTFHLTE